MMIQSTVVIVGPGCVGKGPLNALFKDDITKIDPYRLRSTGPRDPNDELYAHPKLRRELYQVLCDLGDQLQQVPCAVEKIEWFPRGKVLFFTVRRRDWQCLVLNGLDGPTAKAEIYAPVLPALLSHPGISGPLGEIEILILNPASESLTVMRDVQELKTKTKCNCELRGDSAQSVQERVAFINEEAPVWREFIERRGATEYQSWEFAEYVYTHPCEGKSLLKHQQDTLISARERLLEGNSRLTIFFKSVDEIRQIEQPFVK